MFNLPQELDAIRATLLRDGIEYAIRGGIAMAVHGFTRATEDIDLFIRPDDWTRVKTAVARLGYKFEAHPMSFSNGATEIRRISKIDPADGDVLMLDFLLVTPTSEWVWKSRQLLQWRGEPVSVVSREGLIALKRFRSSDQDLVDIRKLESGE
jgi:hypothetical protein